MGKVTARALREHLREKPHDVLVEEIVQLSSRNDAVREYFAAQLGVGPQADVMAKYRAVITREFSGRGDNLPRLSTARSGSGTTSGSRRPTRISFCPSAPSPW